MHARACRQDFLCGLRWHATVHCRILRILQINNLCLQRLVRSWQLMTSYQFVYSQRCACIRRIVFHLHSDGLSPVSDLTFMRWICFADDYNVRTRWLYNANLQRAIKTIIATEARWTYCAALRSRFNGARRRHCKASCTVHIWKEWQLDLFVAIVGNSNFLTKKNS